MPEFNKIIKYLRKKEGLSQEELAEKINLNRILISRLERGQTPRISEIGAYMKYYDVTADFILGFADDEIGEI